MATQIFYFHPYLGDDSHFDEHIFQMGWFNHQLVVDNFDLEKPYCFKMEKSHNNLTIQSSRQSKNETSNQFLGGGVWLFLIFYSKKGSNFIQPPTSFWLTYLSASG